MKSKNTWLATGVAIGTGALSFALVRRHRRILAESLAWQKQRRPALDVLACPECHGGLTVASPAEIDGYYCPTCQRSYPVMDGIPHFIQPQALTGLNKRFSQMYDWFSWGYRAFSKAAFAFIGMTEEQGRREVTDRLEPNGGRLLEVSIGPGVNLPYLVGRAEVGEIFGLDISLGQLKRCREYVAHQGWDVQLQLGNAEQLPYQDNTFNAVFHIGGINFFNDKQKAIEEMIRVASPGARILIADEYEKGAQRYEQLFPTFGRYFDGKRAAIVPPLDLVPEAMLEQRVFDIWKGWFYCIEFRKPYKMDESMR
ncbi:MAG TPA: methyltransferase domain-containing protein [Anaerolineales bacterium]|nr:methyltransferase domain-containing protein [Anaerolineales bacterium]